MKPHTNCEYLYLYLNYPNIQYPNTIRLTITCSFIYYQGVIRFLIYSMWQGESVVLMDIVSRTKLLAYPFLHRCHSCSAYNLGTLLKTEPTSRGFLYFISCFFPLQILWIQKMFYDSRFAIPHDDVFHRMYEFAGLVLLATAVLYIRPVSILADPTNHIDMFCFSLSIALAMILGCGRAVELYVKGIGQPALKSAAKRDVFMTLCPLICYIAAAFVSGLEYYDHSRIIIHTNTTNDKSVNDNHYYADNKSEQNSTSFEDVQDRRVLAAEMATNSATYDTVNENNLPIYLILAGGILFSLSLSIMVLTLPGGGKHKEYVTKIYTGTSTFL